MTFQHKKVFLNLLSFRFGFSEIDRQKSNGIAATRYAGEKR